MVRRRDKHLSPEFPRISFSFNILVSVVPYFANHTVRRNTAYNIQEFVIRVQNKEKMVMKYRYHSIPTIPTCTTTQKNTSNRTKA